MEKIHLPGFAVAVADKDGIIYSKGFGLRSLDPPQPFTPDTATYIASTTKVFVVMAIMQLAEEGKLDLDAPVKAYLPRFELSDAELTKTITIRDLLTHKYGLSSRPIVFADAYTGQITDDLYYRELAKANIKGSWGYSNIHFTLLGRVIEAVTGQSWKDYLAELIFEPAGMGNTTAYASELYGSENASTPLQRVDDEWQAATIRKIDSTMHAAGGMGSSAEDLARWTQLHMNGGAIDGVRLLREESIDEIFTVHERPGSAFFLFDRPEMGLGWYIGRYEGERMMHHFGGYVGAHAHCSFLADHRIGVAVVANSGGEGSILTHHIAADIYDVVLDRDSGRRLKLFARKTARAIDRYDEESAEGALPDGPPELSLQLNSYTGTYADPKWGTLVIEINGDNLEGHLGNLPFSIHPNEKDRPILDSYMGSKELQFVIENGRVTEAQVLDFWGETMRFVREE